MKTRSGIWDKWTDWTSPTVVQLFYELISNSRINQSLLCIVCLCIENKNIWCQCKNISPWTGSLPRWWTGSGSSPAPALASDLFHWKNFDSCDSFLIPSSPLLNRGSSTSSGLAPETGNNKRIIELNCKINKRLKWTQDFNFKLCTLKIEAGTQHNTLLCPRSVFPQ